MGGRESTSTPSFCSSSGTPKYTTNSCTRNGVLRMNEMKIRVSRFSTGTFRTRITASSIPRNTPSTPETRVMKTVTGR